jgi:hypothetical protein
LAHIAVQMQAQKSWFYHPQIIYTSCQILEVMQEMLEKFLLFMHDIMLRIRQVGISCIYNKLIVLIDIIWILDPDSWIPDPDW